MLRYDYVIQLRLKEMKACSSVDRALDSDSKSHGFDSLHAYTFFNK